MWIVDQYGEKVHLNDDELPEKMREWCFSNVKMVQDDTTLEKCWIAQVNRRTFHSHEYEFVGEKVYDHYPTETELVWLMCEYEALRNSYVSILKGYQLVEED